MIISIRLNVIIILLLVSIIISNYHNLLFRISVSTTTNKAMVNAADNQSNYYNCHVAWLDLLLVLMSFMTMNYEQ